MSLHDGDFGNARGRREAFENRDAIERLAKREADDACRTRNRLETGSPSWARRNFADVLNALVADGASRELPGLAALEGIRKRQQYGYRSAEDHNRAYEKFQKSEAFGEAARARDYRSSGEPAAIEAEGLLSAARALIEAVRARAARFPEGRRDR